MRKYWLISTRSGGAIWIDTTPRKQCGRCHKWYTMQEFYKKGRGRDCYCRYCRREIQKQLHINRKSTTPNKIQREERKTSYTHSDIQHTYSTDGLIGILEGVLSGRFVLTRSAR